MINFISNSKITSKEPLRKILFEDFKSIGSELPIKGGWGYSKDTAIIIDKNDPAAIKFANESPVELEYFIVEKRIYEELIIYRQENDKYSGIKWNLIIQNFIKDGERNYDYLKFKVIALKDLDFNLLKKEWEENINNPNFNKNQHEEKRIALLKYYEPEYWFDITSYS